MEFNLLITKYDLGSIILNTKKREAMESGQPIKNFSKLNKFDFT